MICHPFFNTNLTCSAALTGVFITLFPLEKECFVSFCTALIPSCRGKVAPSFLRLKYATAKTFTGGAFDACHYWVRV
jgi:hypothetical protein